MVTFSQSDLIAPFQNFFPGKKKTKKHKIYHLTIFKCVVQQC